MNIKRQTMLNVADNTGAKKLMCIGILGNARNFAKIGDIIVAVVKEVTPNMDVKKSSVVFAVIVRLRAKTRREFGTYISFSDNAAVIINKDNTPKGTRVFGPIAEELRIKKFNKLVSISNEII